MVCRQFWVKSQSDDQRYKYISTVKKLASLGIIVTAATVKHHHYKKSVVTKLLEPPLKRTYRYDRLSTWLDQRKIQVGCSFKQTNALNSIICIIFSLGTAAHQFTLLWQLLRLLIYTRAPHSFTHRHTDTPARSCKVNEWLLLLTGVHWIHTFPWWILRWSWYFNCKGSWPSGAEGVRGVLLCRVSSWGWSRASWCWNLTQTMYQCILLLLSISFCASFSWLWQNRTRVSNIFASYSFFFPPFHFSLIFKIRTNPLKIRCVWFGVLISILVIYSFCLDKTDMCSVFKLTQ